MINRLYFPITLLVILSISGCGSKKEQTKQSRKPIADQQEEVVEQKEIKELDDLLDNEFDMPDYENELIGQ